MQILRSPEGEVGGEGEGTQVITEGGESTTPVNDGSQSGIEGGEGTQTQEGQQSEVIVDETNNEPVDFNTFLDAKNGLETKPAVKEGEQKKEGEVKVEGQQQPKVEGKQEKPTLSQQASQIKPRDYTGISPEHKNYFERMSNEAFNFIKPLYQKAAQDAAELTRVKAELETRPKNGELPPSYYENPNAYVLTPEFAQVSQNVQAAQSVVQHWKRQVDAVRAGAKEYDSLINDPQTGALRIGGKIAVDEGTQSALEGAYVAAINQHNQWQGKLGAVKESFTGRQTSAMNDLRTYEAQTFKQFEDPNHPLQPQIKDTIARLHPAFRNSPLAPLVAKSIVALTVLANKYKALQDGKTQLTPQQQAAQRAKAAQKKAGPTAGGGGTVEVNKGDEDLFEQFQKAKE